MLTIYGVHRSRASRVIWLCHELGLPFQQVPVIQAYRLADPTADDAPLNTRSPEFLRLSPAGAIPVIDDDGVVLSESLTCTLYLAGKAGGPVGPQTPVEAAQMLQWSFYAVTAIEPDALTIQMLHRPGQEQDGEDAGIVAGAAERLVRPFKVLEDHLALYGNLVGDRFTVADLNLAEVVRYAKAHGELLGQFPAVENWLSQCQDRPAFKKMWAERAAEPE